jgi:hypothetical protein
LFFRSGMCPKWGPTTRIPFRMYTVINVYSKSCGIFSQFTVPAKGGLYSGKTDGICFALARSSQCFLHFSAVRPEHFPVDGDACNFPFNDACIPTDMTLSTMRSTRISSTNFSNALGSLNIHTCNKINWVGK